MASIPDTKEAVRVKVHELVFGPSVNFALLPFKQRNASDYAVDRLLRRPVIDPAASSPDETIPVEPFLYNLAPGQKLTQVRCSVQSVDRIADGNATTRVCAFIVAVHRALHSDRDEHLYVDSEMLENMEDLVAFNWRSLPEVDSVVPDEEPTIGQADRVGIVITYEMEMTLRVQPD